MKDGTGSHVRLARRRVRMPEARSHTVTHTVTHRTGKFMRLNLLPLVLLVAPVAATSAQCAPEIQKRLVARQLSVAQSAVEAQLGRNRGDDRALHCLARIAMEHDDAGHAVDLLEQAVAKRPKNAEHHLWLGLALRLQAARAGMLRMPTLMTHMKSELETALSIDSNLTDAHYALLQFYAQVPQGFGGSITTARAHAASLRKLSPMRAQIGLAYIAEQEKRIADAEREYLAATVTSPDSDAVFAAAGSFYRRQERWADAVRMHERQTRVLPGDALPSRIASAHYALGLALDKAGQPDAAQASYRKALAANPDHIDAAKAVVGDRR